MDHKWIENGVSPFQKNPTTKMIDLFSERDNDARFLVEEMNDPVIKSNYCKTECIDKKYIWCPNANYSMGYCCKADEFNAGDCPKAEYCSNENSRAPNYFKYITCPNEGACGTKIINNIEYNGTIYKRAVDKYAYNYVKDDVCSYIIYTPFEMKEYDKMYIKFYGIENADVYISKGKGYKWINHLDSMAYNDDVFTTSAGWQFYVVGVGNNIFKGTFKFKVWVEQNNPPPKPTPTVPTVVDTTTKPTTPVIIDQNKNTTTNSSIITSGTSNVTDVKIQDNN